MGDTNFVLPGPETVTMSGDAARRLIGCGSGDAALLYLHILTSGGRLDLNDAALKTGRSTQQLETALAVLRRVGLVNPASAPKEPEAAEELPQYTREDIQRELSEGEAFPRLVADVQRALGKVLTSDDMMRLYGIYDHLGLPPEVIIELVGFCKEECAATGRVRAPGMRYIEKAAFTWERMGIFSLEAAEAFLHDLHQKRSRHHDYAYALHRGNRPLTDSEAEFVDSWIALGFSPEAAALAYDRTVLNTGKLVWKYMDSIMKNWHSRGLHTPEEILAGDPVRGPKAVPAGKKPAAPSSPDLERMRKTLERITKE